MVLMEPSALADQPEYVEEDDRGELETTSYGCWCCWRPGKRYNLSGKEEEEGKEEEGWFVEKLKNLKEFSEILAGPKWKNFIRRKRRIQQQQQYDPQSYALNFDDGIYKEIDLVFPNFSARFATLNGNNKGVVAFEGRLGGKETNLVITDGFRIHR